MVPIHHLTKKEIVYLAKHYCEHGHSYLSHYSCYLKLPGKEPKVGFLDIETTNLSADFGIILSWCIKEAGKPVISNGVITKEEIEEAKAGDEDYEVVKSLLYNLSQYDKLITYYGKRFDVPFIRTRATSLGLEFPTYGTLDHIDLYDVVKRKFRLSSNRLEQACRILLGDTNKTKIEYKYWRAGARGEKSALAYILQHNRMDVVDLERLYNKTISFTRKNDTSI
jgi:uncharacterized protein YprB with RNaseH-like and TPR domain